MSYAASARHGTGAAGEYLSIGEVLGRLRADFPDITISKIRFLEAEGLIEPERAPSGYRKFQPTDIERLRFILTAQRDHYLPLKVIKDHLDAVDRGEDAPLPGVRRLATVAQVITDDNGYPNAGTFARGSDVRMTREDLLELAAISSELLGELESYGLIARRRGSELYDGEAAAIAKVAGELASYGLEPRHLRGFRTAADREVGLIDQLAAPLRRQREAAADEGEDRPESKADETSRELAAGFLKLHALLVKDGLRRQSKR